MSTARISWQQIHNELSGSKNEFERQLKNSQKVQQCTLLQLLKNNTHTLFGQENQFSNIASIKEFQRTIPVQHYEDCLPYINKIASDKEANVICFEATGGSTGLGNNKGTKLVPFTENSLSAFQQALFPWLDDLLTHRPGIKTGSAYWSISPAMRDKQYTDGGHPIGLDNDALYFGESMAYSIGQTLAVSPQVSMIDNLEEWRFQTLCDLLLADDLSFISVWSPTFLLELLYAIPQLSKRLLSAINKKSANRAMVLQPLLTNVNASNIQQIWPKLDTISCWIEASSSGFIPEICRLFPNAYIQGKGLLATEGIVTIPLCDAPYPVLSISSGFYEFLDAGGNCKLAHELEEEQRYTVILTNESHFYRYNLGDKVRMKGYYKGAPMLSFIGRGEKVSDICGEKLTEDFVVDVFAQYGKGSASLCFLYPQIDPQNMLSNHYVLVTNKPLENNELQKIDALLCQNPQYKYARKLGQLSSLQQRIIVDSMPRYRKWQLKKGQNLGDIKATVLITDKGFINSLGALA